MHGILALIIIFILDLIFGDPEGLPHPVVLMGRVISEAEEWLRAKLPHTSEGEKKAGFILTIGLPLVTFVSSALIIHILYLLFKPLAFLLSVFWGYQCIAVRDMMRESMGVHARVDAGDLSGARAAVGRIVGRDTERLGFDGVIRACVETVAESFSDGYFAPMLFFAIGGAPLSLAYKAINTMDSMIGYKNDRYLYFGFAAARLDDVANFIPSRISAFLLMGAAELLGMDGAGAYRIWKRDRKKSVSPNSGQTEAAMAGALHVRLLGPAYYFGKLYDKPWIGDDIRPVEAYDIKRANHIFMVASVLGLIASILAVLMQRIVL